MGVRDANQPWEGPVLTVSLGLSVLLTQSPSRTERHPQLPTHGQSLVRTVSHHHCHPQWSQQMDQVLSGLGTDAIATGLLECVNFRLCVCSCERQTEALRMGMSTHIARLLLVWFSRRGLTI